jgi:hypothetical protein
MLYAMGKGEDKGTLTPIVVAFIAAGASIAVAVIGLSRKTDAPLPSPMHDPGPAPKPQTDPPPNLNPIQSVAVDKDRSRVLLRN